MGIVYHHFWLHPELRIMNVIVAPLNSNLRNIAKFRTPVYQYVPRKRPADNIRPAREDNFQSVKSTSHVRN